MKGLKVGAWCHFQQRLYFLVGDAFAGSYVGLHPVSEASAFFDALGLVDHIVLPCLRVIFCVRVSGRALGYLELLLQEACSHLLAVRRHFHILEETILGS